MPYRHASVLRTYPLKTARMIYVVTVGLALLSLAVLAMMFWAFSDGQASARLIVLAVVLMAATAAYVSSISNHVVFSGTGELRIYARHIEVPRAFNPKPIVFEIERLEVAVDRFEGRFAFQTVSAVEVVRFRSGSIERALSSRMFEDLEALQRAAQDIVTLREGGPLPDRTLESLEEQERESLEEQERDAYDDALDKELEQLDLD